MGYVSNDVYYFSFSSKMLLRVLSTSVSLLIFFSVGFVGELRFDKTGENAKHVLYTHRNFFIKYNGNQVNYNYFMVFSTYIS